MVDIVVTVIGSTAVLMDVAQTMLVQENVGLSEYRVMGASWAALRHCVSGGRP